MPWWKIALPVVIAGSGVTAAVVATARSDDAAPAVATVWFDAPDDLTTVPAGQVVVQAHTDASVDRMTLTVDGTAVATDDQLVTVDALRYAEFTWDAAVAGSHELQVTAGDAVSGVRIVLVDDSPTNGTTTTSTVPTTSTSSTATTSTSTTSTSSTTTTLPPTTAAPTSPPTTARPVTTPPTTVPKPVIGDDVDAQLDSSCNLRVTVSMSGAAQATARVTAGSLDVTAPFDLGVTPPSVTFFSLASSGVPVKLVLTATGPGGTTTKNVVLTLPSCKP